MKAEAYKIENSISRRFTSHSGGSVVMCVQAFCAVTMRNILLHTAVLLLAFTSVKCQNGYKYNIPKTTFDNTQTPNTEDNNIKNDYPAYDEIPTTSFTCANKMPGYYADKETRCQVFHICTANENKIFRSHLCPNESVFNQETQKCDWWEQVNCEESEKFYYKNKDVDVESASALFNQITQILSASTPKPSKPYDISTFNYDMFDTTEAPVVITTKVPFIRNNQKTNQVEVEKPSLTLNYLPLDVTTSNPFEQVSSSTEIHTETTDTSVPITNIPEIISYPIYPAVNTKCEGHFSFIPKIEQPSPGTKTIFKITGHILNDYITANIDQQNVKIDSVNDKPESGDGLQISTINTGSGDGLQVSNVNTGSEDGLQVSNVNTGSGDGLQVSNVNTGSVSTVTTGSTDELFVSKEKGDGNVQTAQNEGTLFESSIGMKPEQTTEYLSKPQVFLSDGGSKVDTGNDGKLYESAIHNKPTEFVSNQNVFLSHTKGAGKTESGTSQNGGTLYESSILKNPVKTTEFHQNLFLSNGKTDGNLGNAFVSAVHEIAGGTSDNTRLSSNFGNLDLNSFTASGGYPSVESSHFQIGQIDERIGPFASHITLPAKTVLLSSLNLNRRIGSGFTKTHQSEIEQIIKSNLEQIDFSKIYADSQNGGNKEQNGTKINVNSTDVPNTKVAGAVDLRTKTGNVKIVNDLGFASLGGNVYGSDAPTGAPVIIPNVATYIEKYNAQNAFANGGNFGVQNGFVNAGKFNIPSGFAADGNFGAQNEFANKFNVQNGFTQTADAGAEIIKTIVDIAPSSGFYLNNDDEKQQFLSSFGVTGLQNNQQFVTGSPFNFQTFTYNGPNSYSVPQHSVQQLSIK